MIESESLRRKAFSRFKAALAASLLAGLLFLLREAVPALGLIFAVSLCFALVLVPLSFVTALEVLPIWKMLVFLSGSPWTRLALTPAAPPELRGRLAEVWRENGRAEHASVAAFARLSLQLMQLGAPARLIEDANRDSLDEIRHAEICFSMARALDGKDEGPARFPAVSAPGARFRTLALVRLAVESLIDGALGEGAAARELVRLAESCDEPGTAQLLAGMAAEEGRHAAHAWDVVEWCVAEGGAPVARALMAAVRAIPDRQGPRRTSPSPTSFTFTTTFTSTTTSGGD